MAKQKASTRKRRGKDLHRPGEGQKFRDRNLMGVSPLKEQFEPTDSDPIRQHKKMAGMD